IWRCQLRSQLAANPSSARLIAKLLLPTVLLKSGGGEAAYPALYSTAAGQCISPLPYITTVIERRLGCEYYCATRELVSSQSLRDALAGNAGRFWAAGRAHCSRRSSITVWPRKASVSRFADTLALQ